jgi:hypothetical protein
MKQVITAGTVLPLPVRLAGLQPVALFDLVPAARNDDFVDAGVFPIFRRRSINNIAAVT